ncbi:MAG: hypothetical protein AAF242_08575 [Bacteroidota bacterium]
MRRLTLFLVLFVPCLLFTQTNNCDITITNLQCIDGADSLSFNMTVTSNGFPVRLRNSSPGVFQPNGVSTELLRFDPDPNNSTSPRFDTFELTSVPITAGFRNNGDCDDVFGQTLEIRSFFSVVRLDGSSSDSDNFTCDNGIEVVFPERPSTEPLPMMSRWSLVIMGLLMVGTSLFLVFKKNMH